MRFECSRLTTPGPHRIPAVPTLNLQMLVLVLIGWPVLEVFVFIEVARAIGWLTALVLLIATSVLGAQLLRVQGRSAIERLSLAVSERRAPASAAIDGALGFLGGLLLVVPGFVTDALGLLLVFAPTRAQARRWIARHYAGRVLRFLAATRPFASGRARPHEHAMPPADVDGTAVEDDLEQLGR